MFTFPEWADANQKATPDPLAKQIGGDHYKQFKIQPVEYIMANNLGFCEGSAIKYITRHALKGGKADILKAIHLLEIVIKMKYPDAST